MTEKVKNKLVEAEEHMKPYMDNMNETKALREMCKNCEIYCGKQHDYSECRNKWCYTFWLAYEYLVWESSYE